MESYETWQNINKKYPKPLVGLGNFDGVHLGHKKLISELVAAAKKKCAQSLIFTFHPHPTQVLNPKTAPPLLLTPRAKENMIASLGIDVFLRAPFTTSFARTFPEAFIEKVLVQGLGARTVFVGYNYTFGYKGRGDAELLKKYSQKYGYELCVIPPVIINNRIVSSTLIRQLLKDGEVYEASKYLGYFPFVEGIVTTGDKRGSALGFPTANLEPDGKVLIPANGVYSVQANVDGHIFFGVCNIGMRPTFRDRGIKPNIEVHLLDFAGDLYHKYIQVYFVGRLRGEKRFSSPDELITQIEQDILKARKSISVYNGRP